jgi:hypothetical protein
VRVQPQSGKCEFGQIRPPDNDPSRRAQALDDDCVLRSGRRIGQHSRSGGRRQSANVEEILDRDRNAAESAGPDSGATSAVDRVGFGARGLSEQMHERA